MKKDDPCIGICQWDGRTGWCLGCGRTVPETKAWGKIAPYRRMASMRELSQRVARLKLSGKATPASPQGKRSLRPK